MSKPNFFSTGSPYLSHPLLTAERTVKEVDFVVAQLGLSPGAQVLDVGCGPGRHAIELARRGYEVVGIDPAPAMIVVAQARAAEMGVSVDFRQVSGESFVAERPFDAALCLFTTLGQISEAGENSGLVRRVYDALRPGGGFVVEVPQRDWVVQHLKSEERFGDDQRYTAVKRWFDGAENTVTEVFDVVSPESGQSYLLRYRLYSQAELMALLRRTGFSALVSFGDYAGNPLGPDSAVMVLVGRTKNLLT